MGERGNGERRKYVCVSVVVTGRRRPVDAQATSVGADVGRGCRGSLAGELEHPNLGSRRKRGDRADSRPPIM